MNKVKIFFKSFSIFEYISLTMALALMIVLGIIFKTNILDIICAIVCIICLILGAKGYIINVYFGIVYALSYGVICLFRHLYGSAMMSFLYTFPVQILVLIQWRKNSVKNEVIPRKLSLKIKIILATALVISIGLLYFILIKSNGNSALFDAVITIFNIAGMALFILRYYESWLFSGLGHLINSVMWLLKVIKGDSGVVFIVSALISFLFCAYGLYNWNKKLKEINRVKNLEKINK